MQLFRLNELPFHFLMFTAIPFSNTVWGIQVTIWAVFTQGSCIKKQAFDSHKAWFLVVDVLFGVLQIFF